ncbi:hypothetical protein A3H16_04090 [Candidatus Kaiserbacteria bacterium RIFCSPLOWO2_12_FULL_53_8]|uniref:JAB domain-containing protein n=2 Tax=Candidatus Kaiseribacteriota TaxID=1752734 RepID=A0A1F6CTG6_9BACT|nr:MAG: hypothetical protein A2851_05530 [Candidatus Kaiserbacteria bacterium RIFCSPHIGHO2_01_FULL_53_29]OGG92399.1 MAG: hypothetical protein A3H16_04090 [Candidatus Kaiserbacteria bacterium RIFCSPLOWO2_12_FULL_53_8]
MRKLDFLVHGIFPVYLADAQVSTPTEDLAYVIDGAGWKLFKRNGISTALVPLATVNGLPALEPAIDLTAAKLPLDLVRRVTAWFRAVYLKHKSEAVGYLYYADGNWDFVVPPQTVSAAHATYDAAPRREGWTLAGTIHSHAAMSAFHSGTDDADEANFDGVHITIGKLDSVPEYSCSIVVQGVRRKVDPSDLVDGMAPAEMVPVEWLAAIKLPRPVGLAEPHAANASAHYDLYYAGKISEDVYVLQLNVIKAADEAGKKSTPTSFSPFAGREVGNPHRPFGGGRKKHKRK